MNTIANIWNHPRTSAAGLLIGLAGIGSILGQQGITLGKAGTGTVVSLGRRHRHRAPRPSRPGPIRAAPADAKSAN